MAGIANIRTVNVARSLATGGSAIVTTNTSANHVRVIDVGYINRCPRRRSRGVAGIAGVGTINVSGALARGNDTVMATGAVTDDL